MRKTISRETIKNGLANGVIQLILDPIMESGTVCKIGDGWFYFGGITAEDMYPDEFIRGMQEDDVIDDIYKVLNDFRAGDVFLDEYEYYRTFLEENLTMTVDVE